MDRHVFANFIAVSAMFLAVSGASAQTGRFDVPNHANTGTQVTVGGASATGTATGTTGTTPATGTMPATGAPPVTTQPPSPAYTPSPTYTPAQPAPAASPAAPARTYQTAPQGGAATGATTAPAGGPVYQTGPDGLPPVREEGGVRYVTGGFGIDESTALKNAMRNYSVGMVFSERTGAYLASIPVEIKAAGGSGTSVVLTAQGPYLLVDLPNGRYTATATFNGKPITRNFTVSGKGQQIGFAW